MKEKQQRWSGERVWKTEECAEAAELLSGLVAAVIILMLVVKPLWVEGKKPLWLILCPPQPPDAKLQRSADRLLHHHHQPHVSSATNVITVGLGGSVEDITMQWFRACFPALTVAFKTTRIAS